jgi:hypothetical protein
MGRPEYRRPPQKRVLMCNLQAWTCLRVEVPPRQWGVGPSSDSRLRSGETPGWGKLCRKRAGKSLAQAAGKDLRGRRKSGAQKVRIAARLR